MFAAYSKYALRVAVIAFAGVVLLDPGDDVLFIKLSLLILLSLWIVRIVSGLTSIGSLRVCTYVLLFALILPALASFVALMGDTLPIGEPLKFRMIKEFSMLLIIPVIVSERIDLIMPIVRWSILIAVLTLLLVVLSLAAPPIFLVAQGFAVESGVALIRDRAELGLGIGSFYYKTASVLVFPIAYHFRNLLNGERKLISVALLLIFIAAVLCTDSRALVIAVFLVAALFVTQKLRNTFGWTPALFVFFVILALPAGYFATFFHSDEISNAAKLGHIRSYAMLFNDHPTYLLWGQGADTEFYTEGFEDKTTLTELTYLDLVRWFGIPVAVLIMGATIYPIFALARHKDPSCSYLIVPYLAYLWEAASNPLLVSGFGILVVSAMWGTVLLRSTEEPDALLDAHAWTVGAPG